MSILITDNASDDGTDFYIQEQLKQYSDILVYCKHKENIGPDANFDFGVQSSNSDYVYILGDDDLVSPNFIDIALSLIKEYPDVWFIHCNYLIGTQNYKECIPFYKSTNEESLFIIYNSGRKFIQEYLEGPSFISSNIFKKECWLKGNKVVKTDCYGYNWLSNLYYGCLDSPCLFYFFPILIQGCLNGGDYSEKWPLYCIIGFPRLMEHLDNDNEIPGLFKYYQTKLVNQKTHYDFYWTVSQIARYKKNYRTRAEEILTYMPNRKYKIILWLILFVFPTFLTISVFRVLRKFRIL